jgi:hypothetical protein
VIDFCQWQESDNATCNLVARLRTVAKDSFWPILPFACHKSLRPLQPTAGSGDRPLWSNQIITFFMVASKKVKI